MGCGSESTGCEDNLICAAITLGQWLTVKTVMHHFEWKE